MAGVKSNIFHLSFFSPSFPQYFHCGGIWTVVGHVGTTHTRPFMAASGWWDMGVTALLPHSCCNSGNIWSRVCSKSSLRLRNGGDIALHLEFKLRAFLDNTLQTVCHNTTCKHTSTWAHKKKCGNGLELYIFCKLQLLGPEAVYWWYCVLLIHQCVQLGDLYREAGAGLLLAGLGKMCNSACECRSVQRDLFCRVLCVTPLRHTPSRNTQEQIPLVINSTSYWFSNPSLHLSVRFFTCKYLQSKPSHPEETEGNCPP